MFRGSWPLLQVLVKMVMKKLEKSNVHPFSKFGKDGDWDLRKVCKEASEIIYSRLKDDGEARQGRRIASLVRRCRLWELSSMEAWNAWDVLACSDLDPALIPLAQWLHLLSQFHQCSK